jgi:hypothetical protein
MSKNLTRKGLALGASFALVLSALTALPAQAAVGIELTGKDGKTAYGMISGKDYTFTANGNSEFPVGNAGQLRVQITNVDGGSISGLAINGTAVDGDYGATDSDGEVGNLIATAAGSSKASTDSDLGTTAGDKAVFGLGVSREILGANSTSLMTSPFLVKFTATAAADAPKRFDVVVFADSNNNAVLDAGETVSATRTVTFTHPDDIEPVVTITAPTEGDTSAAASFTLPNIAMDQLSNTLFAGVFNYGDNTTIAFTNNGAVRSTWNSTESKFELAASGLASPGLVKEKLLKVQVRYLSGGFASTVTSQNLTDSSALGTAATVLIATQSVKSFTGAVVKSGSSLANGDVAIDGSFQITATAKDGSSPAKAVAGRAVTAKVQALTSGNSNLTLGTTAAAKKVTVNGTTYTSVASLPGATGVAKLAVGSTNASGQVTLNLAIANLVATDKVVVTFYVENQEVAVTATARARTYSGNAHILNAPSGEVVTTDGTPVSLQISIVDQFGTALPSGYLAQAIFDSADGGYVAQATTASTSATSTSADIVNGRATLTITDNGTGVGVNVYDVQYAEKLAGGGLGSPVAIQANLKVRIKSASNATVGSVNPTLTDGGAALAETADKSAYVITAGTRGASNLKAPLQTVNGSDDVVFGNYDSRLLNGEAPNVVTTNKPTLFGEIKSVATTTEAAVVVPNASVTVSGSGLQFGSTQNSKVVYGLGTLTLNADANGRFAVDVFSNKAGKQIVTITSGGKSVKVEVWFDDAAPTAGVNANFVAPKSIKAGRTLVVTVKFTDKYGNPVSATKSSNDLKLTYSGPGFVTNEPEDLVEGAATWRILVGVGDTGPAVFSLSAYTGTDLVSASSATWVGPIANAKAGAKKGRVIVEAYRAKGKTVNVFVGGTRVGTFKANKANFSAVVRGVKSGTRNVRVTLSGPGEDFRGAITVK